MTIPTPNPLEPWMCASAPLHGRLTECVPARQSWAGFDLANGTHLSFEAGLYECSTDQADAPLFAVPSSHRSHTFTLSQAQRPPPRPPIQPPPAPPIPIAPHPPLSPPPSPPAPPYPTSPPSAPPPTHPLAHALLGEGCSHVADCASVWLCAPPCCSGRRTNISTDAMTCFDASTAFAPEALWHAPWRSGCGLLQSEPDCHAAYDSTDGLRPCVFVGGVCSVSSTSTCPPGTRSAGLPAAACEHQG